MLLCCLLLPAACCLLKRSARSTPDVTDTVLDYWGHAGGFGTFSYLFVTYLASLPVTTWCAYQIGPAVAPALFGSAASRSVLMRGALAVVVGMTALSVYMHRRWEFALLQRAHIPHMARFADEDEAAVSFAPIRTYKGALAAAEDDPTAESREQRRHANWSDVNVRHRYYAYDVAALARVPGMSARRADEIDTEIESAQRATVTTVELINELKGTRLQQEQQYGPFKHAIKEQLTERHVADKRGLSQQLTDLRHDESEAFDERKDKLRAQIEKAMRVADSPRRSQALGEMTRELRALREPAAGLSRKQLKTVNGALVAVSEARARTVARPLTEERRMMRHVAHVHGHGRK